MQVLLIAAVVGRKDDFRRRALAIVGDVEEVTVVVKQLSLLVTHSQVLAQRDQAVRFLAGGRPVIELRHLLAFQSDVFEPTLADDPLFDVTGPRAGLRFHLVAQRPIEPFPGVFRQVVGQRQQVPQTIDAEDEPYPRVVVPAIQMLGLREVGVPTHQHAAKAAAEAHRQHTINLLGRPFMAGTIPRTIHERQYLARVGQRHDQRVIAPRAVVGDVHARFALACGRYQRAVHVDSGFGEELRRLRGPDFVPHLVKHVPQRRTSLVSKRRQKSPAVVGSGIRRAPTASRNTSSLRRSSISSRHVPSHSALYARFNRAALQRTSKPSTGMVKCHQATDAAWTRVKKWDRRKIVFQTLARQSGRCAVRSSAARPHAFRRKSRLLASR